MYVLQPKKYCFMYLCMIYVRLLSDTCLNIFTEGICRITDTLSPYIYHKSFLALYIVYFTVLRIQYFLAGSGLRSGSDHTLEMIVCFSIFLSKIRLKKL